MIADTQTYLQALAYREAVSVDYMLKLYGLESIVRRLALHPAKHEIVVRGSFITRVWAMRDYRPVDDLDFLFDFAPDSARGMTLLREILAYPLDDSVTYLPEQMHITPTWVETPLPGERVVIPTRIFGRDFELQIDLAYHDPLVPPAMLWAYPTLLPAQEAEIYTIRPELACAWKVHGLFEFWNRRSTAWELKDLYDIYLIHKHKPIDEFVFAEALEVAFENRGTPMYVYKRVLEGVFGQSKGTQKRWEKFLLKRNGRVLFDSPQDLLLVVRAFLDKFFVKYC